MGGFFDPVRKFFKSDPNEIGQSGYTRLQSAIADHNIKKLRGLIAAGADINLCGKYKEPPLHMAIKRESYSIVMELLEAAADVNLADSYGQRPLHLAVAQSQESFLLALLKLKADPNLKDDLGRTPLHLASPYRHAIAETLVKNKARVSEQDQSGNTPLHRFLDYPAMAERMLVHGADLNIRNRKGQSPFMLMLDDKHLPQYSKAALKMIAARADLLDANDHGETLLHLTARLEMEEVFLSVTGSPALKAKDANDNNVLHALRVTQNAAMIRAALKNAPELVSQANKNGLTPLEETLRCLPVKQTKKARWGEAANENRPDAAYEKWVEAALALLDGKAHPDSADDKGRGLLHHAVLIDKPDFLEAVLAHGANPNLEDSEGKTALHRAIESNPPNMRAMDILLDRGANPDMTDARGWTILDRLAESGDRDSPVVQRLIVAGGQYQKQLPLYPDVMRRPRVIDKGKPGIDKPGIDKGGRAGPRL